MQRMTQLDPHLLRSIPMPYGTMLRNSFHFAPDAGDGGGGDRNEAGEGEGREAGTKQGGDGKGGGRQEGDDVIPRAEAQRAFKDRDRAKAGVKLLAAALGIDPADVRIVPTDDEENPWRLEADGLDEAISLLSEARTAKTDGQKRAGKWEERETELKTQYDRKLTTVKTGFEKRIGGLEDFVRRMVVVEPIRAAAAAEHAIDDDGKGAFDDLVTLLSPRLRTEIDFDEETGRVAVKVTPVDEAGEPMADKKSGDPLSIRQFVADFLGKRPKYRQAKFRSGPGAVGHGGASGSAVGGSNGNGHHAEAAADEMFGVAVNRR